MTIEEIKTRLRYARQFTPHKIGYYEDMLQEAEYNLMQQWEATSAENSHKARSKRNFYRDQH